MPGMMSVVTEPMPSEDAKPPAGLTTAATIAVVGTVVGAAVWADHALDRWWKENWLLAGPKARIEHARSSLSDRMEYAGAIGLLAGVIGIAIAQAASAREHRPDTPFG